MWDRDHGANRATCVETVDRQLARGSHPGPPMARRLAALAVLASLSLAAPARAGGRALSVVAVESEPAGGRIAPTLAELAALRKDVEGHPDDRTKRVALVRGLLAAKDGDGALAEAKAWRAKDAYNLAAVRALGDVYMERGEREEGERVYSAIVELLPRDPDAQRALATLLKQRGDLDAAHARLVTATSERPDDARLLFELADVELRLGRTKEATERLEKIVASHDVSDQIRYPAKQRLGQLYGEARRRALASGDAVAAEKKAAEIAALGLNGGIENDVKVYLTWDTDRTDVDLWVTTPSREKISYEHRTGKGGEALFDDVTNGYGPESFTAKNAAAGTYEVQVNYFSGRRGPFPEARGEVVVVLDEGRPTERRQVFPYKLFAEKQTVTVARIQVGGAR